MHKVGTKVDNVMRVTLSRGRMVPPVSLVGLSIARQKWRLKARYLDLVFQLSLRRWRGL